MKPTMRTFWVLLSVAFALLLNACGSAAEESADAVEVAAESEAVEEATPAAAETEPAPEAEAEPAEPADEAEGDGAALLSGTLQPTDWVPTCSPGPWLSPELMECETFGGYTILPVSTSAIVRGTLEGTATLQATYVVAADLSYVVAGIASFIGTVGDCGEGTLVYNAAGSGNLDPAQSVEDVMQVYTATAGNLGTVDATIAFDLTAMDGSPELRNVDGTLRCGNDADAVAAVRPNSAVSTSDAQDWTGTGTFARGEGCTMVDEPTEPDHCPFVNGFVAASLFNSLVFTGVLEGEARFIGTNLIDEEAEYEHSGVLIFEGAVAGCGEGTVLMVNEAAGSGFDSTFTHQRGFTPPDFDPGSIGVYVDGFTTPFSLVAGNMSGSVSC